jgi:hypothetical protein
VTIKMHLEGLEQVQARLVAAGPAMKTSGRAALSKEAQDAKRISSSLVPFHTGFLHDSVAVTEEDTRRAFEVTVAYHAPYAGSVHERTYAKHPRGRAKFLEQARNEVEPDLGQHVADAVWDALAKEFK